MWVLRITIGNFMETNSICHTNIDPDKMSIYGYLYIKVYMYDLWNPFMYDGGSGTSPGTPQFSPHGGWGFHIVLVCHTT